MIENVANNPNFYSADNSNTHKDALNAALAMYKKGEYSIALKMYQDLSNYYTSPSLYLELGNCYYKLGKNKYALEYWKKVIELDNVNKYAYSNIGNLYYKTGNISQAIENWLTALTIEPNDAKVNLNIAVAYTDAKMRSEAIRYYERYLRYEENKNEEYYFIENKIIGYKETANEYLKEGAKFQQISNLKAALDCYIKALASYPNYSKTNFNIGSLFFMDHNYEQAIKYWLKSYFIDDSYPKTMLNLAISYDCSRQFDYAYCFYARYSDYIVDNNVELTKVTNRLHQLKNHINNNPYLVEKHLENASNLYHDNDFYHARVEYKNYIMLKPDDKHIYLPIIQKINYYLNPEEKVIEELAKQAVKLIAEERYAEASLIYEQTLKLCDENSVQYSHLKAKYTMCVRKAG